MADTQFVMDGQTDGWTDRQMDGAILICLLKFLQGLKKFQKVKFPCRDSHGLPHIFKFENAEFSLFVMGNRLKANKIRLSIK